MKKIYLLLAMAVLVVAAGCSKNNSSTGSAPTQTTTSTAVNAFDVFYDGKEYKGGVIFSGFPLPGSTFNKNLVRAYENQDVNFNLAITNVPDSGVQKTLCSSACDALNGDTNITFNAIEINLTEFTGTVERVSAGKIIINAAKGGKTLTGSVQWK